MKTLQLPLPTPGAAEAREPIDPGAMVGDPGAMRRRFVLGAAGAGLLLRCVPASAVSTVSLEAAIRQWAGRQPVLPGRIVLEVASLVDNGNSVPIAVRVDSPMTAADHVLEIVVLNERNPQREVARFVFGPDSSRAEVSTRIRLATSQQLVALARLSDGSQWMHKVDVLVTLAACIES